MKAKIIQSGDSHGTLNFLDGLRGIAAALVMIGHVRWLLWEGFSEGYAKHPGQYSVVEKILVYFLSLFRFGHQAVLFFFVLSGFVIHLKYSKRLKLKDSRQFDYKDYFSRRIKRIYPPFLFVVLVTYVLDTWGSHLGFSIYNGKTPNDLINHNVTNNHSLVNLLGNLIFINSSQVGIWGTNSPLWSLKYEWWFYVLYPFLLLVNRKNLYGSWALVIFLFIVSFFIPFAPVQFFMNVFQYLLSWWLGVILADIYTRRISVTHGQLSFMALVLPVVVVFDNRLSNALLGDFCWAVGFFGLLNLLFYARTRGAGLMLLNKLKWLGDCSYTLYIIHFPVTVFFNGLILHYNHNEMPRTLIFVFLMIFFNIFLAYLLHFVIERPFISGARAAKKSVIGSASLN
jgi:peptidoglycan/LPS O-acetylase OafA/YrhL